MYTVIYNMDEKSPSNRHMAAIYLHDYALLMERRGGQRTQISRSNFGTLATLKE